MEKFDVNKHTKLLKKVAKDSNIVADSTILLITNSMCLYNNLVDEYEAGNSNRSYLMFQLSGSIFKQLAIFGQVPAKVKDNSNTEESKLLNIISKVTKK